MKIIILLLGCIALSACVGEVANPGYQAYLEEKKQWGFEEEWIDRNLCFDRCMEFIGETSDVTKESCVCYAACEEGSMCAPPVCHDKKLSPEEWKECSHYPPRPF